MSKRRNRSLDDIVEDINKLARTSIFDIGDLLIEAKERVEHGQWLDWLDTEFGWSPDTAERYMRVAELGTKFRNLRNLKLGSTTLYQLARENKEYLPSIILELVKTPGRLTRKEADRARLIGIGRHHYGHQPEATLLHLAFMRDDVDEPWYPQMVEVFLEQKPETVEMGNSLFNETYREYQEARSEAKAKAWRVEKDVAEAEAEALLDGEPPELPPSIVPPEPQKLESTGTGHWAGADDFMAAVSQLRSLSTKPAARFADLCVMSDLRDARDFLTAVMAASEDGRGSHTVRPSGGDEPSPVVADEGIPAFLRRTAEVQQ